MFSIRRCPLTSFTNSFFGGWSVAWSYFVIALLRYNTVPQISPFYTLIYWFDCSQSCTINFNCLYSTEHWFYYSHQILVVYRVSLLFPQYFRHLKKKFYPYEYPRSSFSPDSGKLLIYLLSVYLPILDISYKWKHNI